MNFSCKTLIAIMLVTGGVSSVNAGVVIGGTRLIYDGNKKEASLSVKNPDKIPYLIQSWIEVPSGTNNKAPFIITPPLYRLDTGQENVMRIVLTGFLPQNNESMYWLNIKSIPSAPRKDNTLQIAVKTRIKLIYRPENLNGSTPEDQAKSLKWQRAGNQVEVTNPSSYYINFNEITVAGKKLDDVTYVAPHSTARFTLPTGSGGGELSFKIINDYGGSGDLHKDSI